MPPPDDELHALPDSLRRAIAAAQRELEVAQKQSRTAQTTPAQRDAPAPPPRLDERTLLEVEAVRGRMLREAFMRGRTGRDSAGQRAGTGLWLGLAVAVALTLAVGLVALIQGTIQQQGKQHGALPPTAVQVRLSF